jgi:hypothetical protein
MDLGIKPKEIPSELDCVFPRFRCNTARSSGICLERNITSDLQEIFSSTLYALMFPRRKIGCMPVSALFTGVIGASRWIFNDEIFSLTLKKNNHSIPFRWLSHINRDLGWKEPDGNILLKCVEMVRSVLSLGILKLLRNVEFKLYMSINGWPSATWHSHENHANPCLNRVVIGRITLQARIFLGTPLRQFTSSADDILTILKSDHSAQLHS